VCKGSEKFAYMQVESQNKRFFLWNGTLFVGEKKGFKYFTGRKA
jgi:hypothetical protein